MDAAHLSGLHVLHALHSYPGDSHGGIETYVQELLRVQRADGLSVTVLAGRDRGQSEPRLREDRHGPDRVLRLRPPRRRSGEVVNADLADLGALLRRERVGLLHVHHWHNLSGDLVARAAEVGVPAVVTLHDHFASCPRFFRLRGEEICAPRVAHATCRACVSEFVGAPEERIGDALRRRATAFRRELELARARLVLSADQLAYVRDLPLLAGLETVAVALPQPTLRDEVDGPAREPRGRLSVVTWGGLVEGKGLHVLAAAARRLAGRVEVHHYGRVLDPNYRARVERLAGGHLHVHGRYGEDTLRRHVGRYDLAVFPSLFRETHGYVVDEAMQLGLPVVVSDRGAPASRLGQRGLSFPAGDDAALAAVLRELADRPERLARLRQGSPAPQPTAGEHWARLRRFYAGALR